MTYTLEEQETHLYYDAIDRKWHIETNYAPHISKLLKIGVEKFDKGSIVQKDEKTDKIVYVKTTIDDEEFNIKPFPKKRRKLSEEKRQILVNRLQKGRE